MTDRMKILKSDVWTVSKGEVTIKLTTKDVYDLFLELAMFDNLCVYDWATRKEYDQHGHEFCLSLNGPAIQITINMPDDEEDFSQALASYSADNTKKPEPCED